MKGMHRGKEDRRKQGESLLGSEEEDEVDKEWEPQGGSNKSWRRLKLGE
jgi:hypothetical protein